MESDRKRNLYTFEAQIHKYLLNKMARNYDVLLVTESPKTYITTVLFTVTDVIVCIFTHLFKIGNAMDNHPVSYIKNNYFCKHRSCVIYVVCYPVLHICLQARPFCSMLMKRLFILL